MRLRTKLIAIVIIALLSFSSLLILRQSPKDIKIGILDSGIGYLERDNVVSKSFVTRQNGYFRDEKPYDLLGHGSAVYDLIMDGISPLHPAIYFGKIVDVLGDITSEGLYNGLRWLYKNNVDIVSLSLGGASVKELERITTMIQEMVSSGIVVVASVGNEGISQTYLDGGTGDFPATLPETIGVGALTPNGDIAGYSSAGISIYGNFFVDFTDLGTTLDGTEQGTSFAVPRVVSKIAQVIQKTGRLPFSALKSLLIYSTQTKDYDTKKGWGVIDPELAIVPYQTNMVLTYFQSDIRFDYYDVFTDVPYSFKTFLYSFTPADIVGYGVDIGLVGVSNVSAYNFEHDPETDIVTFDSTFTANSDVELSFIIRSDDAYNSSLIIAHRSLKYNVAIDGIGHIHPQYHVYGVYSQLTRGLNKIDANVDYLVLPNVEFSKYDFVFTPYLYFKQFDNYNLTTYYHILLDYVLHGGTWLIGLSHAATYYSIPPVLRDYISDYDPLESRSTTEAFGYNSTLFDPNTSVYFDGIGFHVLPDYYNSSVFAVGYVGYEVPVGLKISYGNGTLYYFGSSYSPSDYGLYRSGMKHFIYNMVKLTAPLQNLR